MKSNALPAALLTAAIALFPLAALADDSWSHGGHEHAGYYHDDVRASGTIAEVRGGTLRLEDGRPVFLRRGTVINPTGIDLRPGMRISVSGSPGGDGAINAAVIDVAQRWNGDRNWNGDRHWNGDADWNQNGEQNGNRPHHREDR